MKCPNPECGFECPDGSKFCSQCATKLADEGISHLGEPTGRLERRQLTVLFCDLVDSTRLSEQLEVEDFQNTMQRFFSTVLPAVHSLAGFPAQLLGDAVLVYFGYPQAHEDDARRAVHCGLRILELIQSLNAEDDALPHLDVRIGIHTGLVVAGEVETSERQKQLTALGETPNIAARLQSVAEPNTVLVSEAVRGLVDGFFELEALEPRKLKGISKPVPCYRVVGRSEYQSRFEITEATGLVEFVGREVELRSMAESLRESRQNRGQVVEICGEAGYGKSRLLQHFRQQNSHLRVSWASLRCSPYFRDTALKPVTDALERYFDIDRKDDHERNLSRLQSRLKRLELPLESFVPPLASLLALPLPAAFAAPAVPPLVAKQKLLECLIELLRKSAEPDGLVVSVEDLHWVDPTTEEFIGLLVERVPESRILLLLTFRPEYSSDWNGNTGFTRISLKPLSRAHVERLIDHIAAASRLSAELKHEIASKSDGVPLFIEELTRMLLDSGARSQPIPDTLSGLLTDRLDRLASAKKVAQIGSVLGRHFSYDLLNRVAFEDEYTLRQHLDTIVRSDLVKQRGVIPDAQFTFKHALIVDRAHESIPHSERRELHKRVGDALSEHFPEVAAAEPETLARHYEEAGLPEVALDHRELAGHLAQRQSAHTEAIRHFEKSLEHLHRTPHTAKRDRREIDLLSSLGLSRISTEGFAAEPVEQTFGRAHDLCNELELEIPPRVRFGIWANNLVRSDRKRTREMAKWYARRVHTLKDPASRLMSHACLATYYFYSGDLKAAEQHIEDTRRLFTPATHGAVTKEYGVSGGFYGYLFKPWWLWLMGQPDESLESQQETVSLAETLDHPFTLVEALSYSTSLFHDRREPTKVLELGKRMCQIASEHHIHYFEVTSSIIIGWAMVHLGELDEGIDSIERGLAAFREMEARLPLRFYGAFLVDGLLVAGRAADGLETVAALFESSRDALDAFYDPELYRLRGELLLAAGADSSEAESCFATASVLARKAGATFFELRSATSLARLRKGGGGDADEAREALAAVFNRYRSGHDLPDLREARALLDE